MISTTVKKVVQLRETGTSSEGFQCDKYECTFITVNGVKIHKVMQIKDIQKPEEFQNESPKKLLREPKEDKTETVNFPENIFIIESPKPSETGEENIARKKTSTKCIIRIQ